MKTIAEIIDILEKSKAFPVGTRRTWQGQDYIKHAKGWVAVGGKHHGKMMGKFKEDATHKDFADEHKEKIPEEQRKKDKEFNPNDLIGKKFSYSQTLADKKGKLNHFIENIVITDISPSHIKYKTEDGKANGFISVTNFLNDIARGNAKSLDIKKGDNGLPEQLAFDFGNKTISSEEKKKEEQKAKESITQSVKKSEDVEKEKVKKTPRQKASEATKELDKDYEFARKSKFSNVGEDIKNSARHIRNEWRGLEQAEIDGIADTMIKRDQLLKAEPINLIDSVDKKPLNSLIANQLLKRFPSSPKIAKHLADKADDEKVWAVQFNKSDKIMYFAQRQMDYYKVQPENIKKELTVADYKKIERKRYYDTFNKFKELVLSSVDKENPEKLIENIQKGVKDIIAKNREEDLYSGVNNQLIKFSNKNCYSIGYVQSNSVGQDYRLFKSLMTKKYGNDIKENSDEIKDVIKSIIEGDTIEKAFGEASSKKTKEGFDPASLYVKGARREGPKTGLTSSEKQQKFLTNKVGLRAIQWGNSVTDGEREHHLEKVSEAFYDLTEVLGLPNEMGSFNGKLGLAIGARGKGRALAHYESATNTINLTRKNGVGSLAHEWFHFFDKTLKSLSGQGEITDIYSIVEIKNSPELTDSFQALQSSLNMMKTRIRSASMDKDKKWIKDLLENKGDYWLSGKEMAARCFETYLTQKLKDNKRENTYLTSVEPDANPLWPTSDEIKVMTPIFDKIFEQFKKSEYLKKALE